MKHITLSIHPSIRIHPSNYPSTHTSIHPTIYTSFQLSIFIHRTIHALTHPSIQLYSHSHIISIRLSIHTPMHPSIYLSAQLFINLSKLPTWLQLSRSISQQSRCNVWICIPHNPEVCNKLVKYIYELGWVKLKNVISLWTRNTIAIVILMIITMMMMMMMMMMMKMKIMTIMMMMTIMNLWWWHPLWPSNSLKNMTWLISTSTCIKSSSPLSTWIARPSSTPMHLIIAM